MSASATQRGHNQLHWLLSDVEDLKPMPMGLSQVQNHTGVNVVINDVINNLPNAAIVGWNGRISLANAVPTSFEGNNDSPKNNTNHSEIGEFLSIVFWHIPRV